MDKNKDISYRISVLDKCIANLITQAKASELLNISLRQTQRLIKNYRKQSKAGLFHKLSHRPSNHTIDKEIREKVLKLAEKKYYDFNPTLMSECLQKEEKIEVNSFTLRLWLKKEKLIIRLRKRKSYRTKRERKEYFGEMLQIDGSFHEWFIGSSVVNKEDRKACLINLADDATNTIELLFDKQETTKCASLLLWKWIKKYGIPQSIYCDKRNMYSTEKDKEKNSLNGEGGYFRTLCDNLNIRIIQANSPQAKGRVERSNGVHQDRLVKLMRLKNITNIGEANEYLINEYTEEHNNRFSLIKALNEKLINKETGLEIIDVHRRLNDNITLNDICYMEEARKVNNDWTAYYKGEGYQLKKQSQCHPPTKSIVYVRRDIDGNVSIFYRNIRIEYTVVKR
ncbi:MAG: ISNCY family transposase [Rickettsiales bacterium]|jgi:transposase|nr:ISNCY family transposase [Rickettsiales bacterium]